MFLFCKRASSPSKYCYFFFIKPDLPLRSFRLQQCAFRESGSYTLACITKPNEIRAYRWDFPFPHVKTSTSTRKPPTVIPEDHDETIRRLYINISPFHHTSAERLPLKPNLRRKGNSRASDKYAGPIYSARYILNLVAWVRNHWDSSFEPLRTDTLHDMHCFLGAFFHDMSQHEGRDGFLEACFTINASVGLKLIRQRLLAL